MLRKLRRSSIALAACMLAIGVWWLQDRPGLEYYWQFRVALASDAAMPGVLAQAADSGSAGLRVVVGVLRSPRAAVAAEAMRTLDQKLQQWQFNRWSPREARRLSPKLLELAEALQHTVDDLEPEARLKAADLAARILLWPIDEKAVDRRRLVAACDRILRAQGIDADAKEVAAVEAHTAQPHLETVTSLLEHPQLAGSASPRSERPALPPLPNEVWLGHEGERTASQRTEKPAENTIVPAVVQSPEETKAQPAAAKIEDELAHLDGFELFSRLHTENEAVRAALIAETKRRGYTARQVEVGLHLTSPDAIQRRRWIEALPGLSGLDAKPWMLRLSRDPDPEVRLTAITLMATSSDPEMLRRVAEVARSDQDDRVQEQAARAIESRGGQLR